MSILWGDLREQIRRTTLRDFTPDENSGEFKWTNEELLDYCRWALDEFADHTAVETELTFAATGSPYPLPDNLYTPDPLDISGQVYLVDSDGVYEYLDPIRNTPGLKPSTAKGFYTFPDTTLHVTVDADATKTLYVKCFTYWDHPVEDEDVIAIPRWASAALVYLISAHALSGPGLKTASIRQWGAKPDTGTPEQNPLRQQQKWFRELYEQGISKVDAQTRTNHFREF